MTTTYLPNRYIGEPSLNDTGWGTTVNASLVNIDEAFGGNQAFSLGAASGTVSVSATSYNGAYPANTASYIPLSWTLTGTLTASVTLQIPSGVGGQWIVNNQCTMGSYTITVSASGGSTTTQLSVGIQVVYSDGQGNINTILIPGISTTSVGVVSFPHGAVAAADWNKNRAINSGFDIWQALGTSGSIPATLTYYTADQWQIVNNSSVSMNWQKGNSPAGFSSRYCMNFFTNSFPLNAAVTLAQKFEGQRFADLGGAPIAISFDIGVVVSAGSLTGVLQLATNTALDNGTFSNFVATPSFSVPVGSGRVSVIIPASQTATVINGALIGIALTQTGSTGNISVSIGGVVVEKGLVSNPWAAISIEQEWLDCERFLQTSYDASVPPGSTGQNSPYSNIVEANTSFSAIQCVFRSRMRTDPTITLYSPVTGVSGKIYNFNAAADINGSSEFITQVGFTCYVNNIAMIAPTTITVHFTADSRL